MSLVCKIMFVALQQGGNSAVGSVRSHNPKVVSSILTCHMVLNLGRRPDTLVQAADL